MNKVKNLIQKTLGNFQWINQAVFHFNGYDSVFLYFCLQTSDDELNWQIQSNNFSVSTDEDKAQLIEAGINEGDIIKLYKELKKIYNKHPEFCDSVIFCYKKNEALTLSPDPETSWN